jgi:hypothetical protein
LGRQGRRAGQCSLSDLVDLPTQSGEGWREGHDFCDGQQAAQLAGHIVQRQRAPRWWRVVQRALKDLRQWEATRQLPGGKALSEQVWWQVELWDAYWAGQ